MVLIEIAGPDGSGKSTLVDATRRWLHENTATKAYERVLRSESRNLLEAISLETGDDRRFPVRDVELAVLLDFVRLAHSDLHVYRGSTHSHAFVSHYHCSLLARLHVRGLAADAGLTALLERLPRPDVSVRLTVAAPVALVRLRTRVKGDQLLGRPDPLAESVRAAECFELAGTELPYSQTVLDGAEPVESLIARVLALLDVRPS